MMGCLKFSKIKGLMLAMLNLWRGLVGIFAPGAVGG